MIYDRNMIIVGGTGRNVGKTEFVCRLIQKSSRTMDIYGLKVSSIYPDEELFHGDHSEDESRNALFEETRTEGTKDTSRMLRAGAKRVFYLRSDDKSISSAFREFRQRLPEGAVVVCESNSLVNIVQPGLFIVVRSVDGEVKPRALPLLEMADGIVVSDKKSGFSDLAKISYRPGSGWQYRK